MIHKAKNKILKDQLNKKKNLSNEEKESTNFNNKKNNNKIALSSHYEKSSILNRKLNSMSKNEIDAISHPITNSLNRKLFVYYEVYSQFVRKLEKINICLSSYLYKKKINAKEILIKQRKDEKLKEIEVNEYKKNLEEKVSSALDKANSCLESIKNIGKKNLESNKTNKQKISIVTNESSNKLNSQSNMMNVKDLIKNLGDKFNEEINVNRKNMDNYFSNIAQNKSKIKELKEKLKRINNKHKSIKSLTKNVYSNNISKYLDKKENFSITKTNFLLNLDLDLNIISILKSEIFQNLYSEVLFNCKKVNEISEDDICNVFSFWYIVRNLKKYLLNYSENGNYDEFIKLVGVLKQSLKLDELRINKNFNENASSNHSMKYIVKNLKNLHKSLNNNKKQTNSNFNNQINENEIFSPDFYYVYEIILKLTKTELLKEFTPILRKEFEEKIRINYANSKHLILLFKWIDSIFLNNGNYTYQILNK